MTNVVVMGDQSSHGGSVISAGGTFMTDKGPVAVTGDMHACTIKGHGVTPIIATTGNVKNGGKGVCFTGAVSGCGAMITGSGSLKCG